MALRIQVGAPCKCLPVDRLGPPTLYAVRLVEGLEGTRGDADVPEAADGGDAFRDVVRSPSLQQVLRKQPSFDVIGDNVKATLLSDHIGEATTSGMEASNGGLDYIGSKPEALSYIDVAADDLLEVIERTVPEKDDRADVGHGEAPGRLPEGIGVHVL